jgi:hypothetical protein
MIGAGKMKSRPFVLVAFFAIASAAQAQVNTDLAEEFVECTNYSALMVMQTTPPSGNASVVWRLRMYVAGDKQRIEIDVAQSEDPKMTPAVVANMKKMGLDKMIAIERPDQGIVHIFYPHLLAYADQPLKKPKAARKGINSIEFTLPGTEIIDGHRCIRKQGSYNDEEVKNQEISVWLALDAQNFPVKMKFKNEGNDITLLFQDLKLGRPDDALFEISPRLKKYSDVNRLAREEVPKRMRQTVGPLTQ